MVLNSTDYLREGYRQLSDPMFYQKIDHDPTEKVGEKIDQCLLKMKHNGLITEKTLNTCAVTSLKRKVDFISSQRFIKRVHLVDPYVVQ